MLARLSKFSRIATHSAVKRSPQTHKSTTKFVKRSLASVPRFTRPSAYNIHTKPLSIRWYCSGNVSVPERGIEGFGGPTDEMHYTDEGEKACRRGMALKESGDMEGALEAFTRAIDLDETNYRAYSLRGDLNQTLRRLPEALADYNSVLKYIPTHVPTLTSQASVYKLMGEYEKAKSSFDFILSFESMYAPAWIGKAECHARLGEHKEAAICYQKALDWKDRWVPEASVYEALGDSLIMTNEVEAALKAYQTSLLISPTAASCHGAFGVALYLAQKYPEATDAFTEALKYGGTPKEELLVKRASCYLQFENIERAMADCSEAITCSPGFYKAKLIRGQCYQETGKIKDAIADYDAFISEVDRHLQDAAKQSTEAMSEHWQQVANVRIRRSQCLIEAWAEDLRDAGKEVPQLAEVQPENIAQAELVAKFETMNHLIKSMGPNMAPKLSQAFQDLVEARRLDMTNPDIPFLLEVLNRILTYKFKGGNVFV